MAKAVGGEYVTVSTIIPDGTEPHDFEPKAKDLVALNAAQVFVYNGFDLEKWVPETVQAAQNSALVTVNASDGIVPITLGTGADGKEGLDPHVWLSPKSAEIEARNIASAFAKVDSAHADMYAKNADAFVAALESLYTEYSGKITAAKGRTILTGHAAFAYLCRDFGLTQNSVEDVFASSEPNAQQLAGLVDFARKTGIKTVFAEEMASPAISKTLADEVGAKVKTIYTMESAEDGKSYLDRMSDNLEEISRSLAE
jgi:zinc transport system substrate-binding protein